MAKSGRAIVDCQLTTGGAGNEVTIPQLVLCCPLRCTGRCRWDSRVSFVEMDLITVDFSNFGLRLDTREDAQQICDKITPETEKLVLWGNTFGIESAAAIGERLASCPNLKYAHFKDMFTSRLKSEVPPALKHLFDGIVQSGAQLIELDVSDNAFGPHGAKELRPFLESSSAKKLEVLLLNNLGLGIGGSTHMAPALKELTSLRVLMCGRNRLEVEGSTAIAESLKELNTLEELTMHQNGIRPRGIEAISLALLSNPNLHSLNLMDNTVKSQGARALTKVIERCKSLKSINLSDCLLKTGGALIILEALEGSTALECIDLSGNELGGDDLAHKIKSVLFTRPGLELNLSFNNFGRLVPSLVDSAEEVDLIIEDDEGSECDSEDGGDDDDDDDNQDEGDEDQGDDESYEAVQYEDISYEGNGHGEPSFDQRTVEDETVIDGFISQFFNQSSVPLTQSTVPSLKKLLEQAKTNARYPYQLSNSILVHLGLLKEESTRRYRKVSDLRGPIEALTLCVDILDQPDRQSLAVFLEQKPISSAAQQSHQLLTKLKQ